MINKSTAIRMAQTLHNINNRIFHRNDNSSVQNNLVYLNLHPKSSLKKQKTQQKY